MSYTDLPGIMVLEIGVFVLPLKAENLHELCQAENARSRIYIAEFVNDRSEYFEDYATTERHMMERAGFQESVGTPGQGIYFWYDRPFEGRAYRVLARNLPTVSKCEAVAEVFGLEWKYDTTTTMGTTWDEIACHIGNNMSGDFVNVPVLTEITRWLEDEDNGWQDASFYNEQEAITEAVEAIIIERYNGSFI